MAADSDPAPNSYYNYGEVTARSIRNRSGEGVGLARMQRGLEPQATAANRDIADDQCLPEYMREKLEDWCHVLAGTHWNSMTLPPHNCFTGWPGTARRRAATNAIAFGAITVKLPSVANGPTAPLASGDEGRRRAMLFNSAGS